MIQLRGNWVQWSHPDAIVKGEYDPLTQYYVRVYKEQGFVAEGRGRFTERTAPGGDPCQAGLIPPVIQEFFTILHVNVRGFASHLAEIEGFLALMTTPPNFIALNETFLNKSTDEIRISGYTLVGRRDRVHRRCGGVALFARTENWTYCTLLTHSVEAERSWYIVHADVGPILLCNWYRPPGSGEINSIESFEAEMIIYREQCIGMIMVGDINVHHIPWLTFSHSTTPEGIALESICSRHGLDQIVKEPTRGEYLLDLCATDLDNAVNTEVLASIADHKAVLVKASFAVPTSEIQIRKLWYYKSANWRGLNESFANTDWGWMDTMGADESALALTDYIMELVHDHIPSEEKAVCQTSHPWLNQRCLDLIKAKHVAVGTARAEETARECSTGLLDEYL